MSWVRLDDGFTDHPKIAHVGPVGAWIQIQALCYCNKNLTDGFIPFAVAQGFSARCRRIDAKDRIWMTAETCGMQGMDAAEIDWPNLLVETRMWEAVPGGYQVHDYDHYQRTKAEVLAVRGRLSTARADAGRRGGVQSGKIRRSKREANGKQNGSPVPVPSSERSESLWLIAPASPAAQTRTGRAKPKVPWPEDFALTAARAAYATRQGLDAAYEWGKFRAHALRDDVRHANWERAWEYWVRNAWEIARRHG